MEPSYPDIKTKVMHELGIDQLPAEQQEEAFTRMGTIIFRAVMLRAVDMLDESDQQELERIMDANPQDAAAIFEFLEKKIPNFDAIVGEEVDTFRRDALDVMSQVQ